MTGPGQEQIDHYVRLFEQLDDIDWHLGESLFWTVARPQSVEAVTALLAAEPMPACRPRDLGWEDDLIFIEQRGEAVMLVSPSDAGVDEEALRRMSRGGTVHQVFWAINNFNRLFRVSDGTVVTELDTLVPDERWGADPDALNEHLGALHDLDARGEARGADLDWPAAMATMESLTGFRLDLEWFSRKRPLVRTRP
jgi:hypothetical protein